MKGGGGGGGVSCQEMGGSKPGSVQSSLRLPWLQGRT